MEENLHWPIPFKAVIWQMYAHHAKNTLAWAGVNQDSPAASALSKSITAT